MQLQIGKKSREDENKDSDVLIFILPYKKDCPVNLIAEFIRQSIIDPETN